MVVEHKEDADEHEHGPVPKDIVSDGDHVAKEELLQVVRKWGVSENGVDFYCFSSIC